MTLIRATLNPALGIQLINLSFYVHPRKPIHDYSGQTLIATNAIKKLDHYSFIPVFLLSEQVHFTDNAVIDHIISGKVFRLHINLDALNRSMRMSFGIVM